MRLFKKPTEEGVYEMKAKLVTGSVSSERELSVKMSFRDDDTPVFQREDGTPLWPGIDLHFYHNNFPMEMSQKKLQNLQERRDSFYVEVMCLHHKNRYLLSWK